MDQVRVLVSISGAETSESTEFSAFLPGTVQQI